MGGIARKFYSLCRAFASNLYCLGETGTRQNKVVLNTVNSPISPRGLVNSTLQKYWRIYVNSLFRSAKTRSDADSYVATLSQSKFIVQLLILCEFSRTVKHVSLLLQVSHDIV